MAPIEHLDELAARARRGRGSMLGCPSSSSGSATFSSAVEIREQVEELEDEAELAPPHERGVVVAPAAGSAGACRGVSRPA